MRTTTAHFWTPTSPYRPAQGCSHSRVAERTCDFQPRPFFVEGGAVDCWFIVRARRLECADCGCGIYPDHESVAAAIPRPACIYPACDCEDWNAMPFTERPAKSLSLDDLMRSGKADV